MSYIVIKGKLVARTAIHIGSGRADETTDALIRRDGAGMPLIPGTAIAGALRALATRLGPRMGAGVCAALRSPGSPEATKPCNCAVCRLFGDINPADEEGGVSMASRLLVFNGKLLAPSPGTTIRDGVGIDRGTGAAARAGAVKFDLEVLPRGTGFELLMELRNHDAERDEPLLAAALAEWQAGRAWLGGRVARGLGAFDLKGLELCRLDLNDPKNLLEFLKSDEPRKITIPVKGWLSENVGGIRCIPPKEDHKEAASFIARCWFSVEGILQADGPFLTNDTTTSSLNGFDHAPLLMKYNDWKQPVLSGSSLRGVIRSHAERLARTLATLSAADGRAFLEGCPACNPVEANTERALPSCDSLLGDKVAGDREVAGEQLCLACRFFGSSRWGSRFLVEDASCVGSPQPLFKIFDFLAVDRFTGGGSHGAKFDALCLWRPSFNLKLHVDNPEPWELGWLGLVLRELQAGWLTVGMGAAKGFGRITLKDLRLRLGYLTGEDAQAFGLKPETGSTKRKCIFHEAPIGSLSDMKDWAEAFRGKVTGFKRPTGISLEGGSDTYFNRIDHLYSRKATL